LWQRDFTATLTMLGFKTVPHELCCMIKDGIIIFFYVDDIIIMYYQSNVAAAEEIEQKLKEKYIITGGDDLQWFLGIEVIRNRANRTIYVSRKMVL
jgi:hypothetical protein